MIDLNVRMWSFVWLPVSYLLLSSFHVTGTNVYINVYELYWFIYSLAYCIRAIAMIARISCFMAHTPFISSSIFDTSEFWSVRFRFYKKIVFFCTSCIVTHVVASKPWLHFIVSPVMEVLIIILKIIIVLFVYLHTSIHICAHISFYNNTKYIIINVIIYCIYY